MNTLDQIEWMRDGALLRLNAKGDRTAATGEAVGVVVGEKMASRGASALLIDIREGEFIEGPGSVLRGSAAIAVCIPDGCRVAVLAREDQHLVADGAAAAFNAGGHTAQHFEDEAAAISFLTQPQSL